jgi:putative Mg2+ transporter-C (MgtC) family protein
MEFGVWISEIVDGWWVASTSLGDTLLRMSMALLLAGAVGFERERRGRAAGLRTHMMVGLASTLFTLVALEVFDWVRSLPDDQAAASDPLRLLEAITAGVAFLAAGSIFRSEERVKGLTTGAGLWLAGALGVACGQGAIGLAVVATLMALAVLRLVKLLE